MPRLALTVGCGDGSGSGAGRGRGATALRRTRRRRPASTTRYAGEFEFFVGGGVAAFDCDDDGRDELYFAGGTAPAALYRNESPVGGALALHRGWRQR